MKYIIHILLIANLVVYLFGNKQWLFSPYHFFWIIPAIWLLSRLHGLFDGFYDEIMKRIGNKLIEWGEKDDKKQTKLESRQKKDSTIRTSRENLSETNSKTDSETTGLKDEQSESNNRKKKSILV